MPAIFGRMTGCLLLSWAGLSWAAPSDLDPSFGTGGQTATPAGSQLMLPTSIALDGAGRIYVLVTRVQDSSSTDLLSNLPIPLQTPVGAFQILRFTASGVLDATFASGGVLDLNLGSLTPVGLAVDEAAQRFVLAGGTDQGIGGGLVSVGALAAAVGRIGFNGAYDTAFGSDGIAALPAQGISQGDVVTLLADGDILVGGLRGSSFVMRLNPDGSLDTAFGEQGVVGIPTTPGSGHIFSIEVGEDASLFICGPDSPVPPPDVVYDPAGFIVGRLSADGRPVAGFGPDGWKVIELGFSASCRDIQPGSGGAFAVVGTASSGLTLAKVRADGSLDTTFGGTGISTSPLPSYFPPFDPRIVIGDDGSLILGITGGAISIGGSEVLLFSPGPDHASGGILLRKLAGSPELRKVSSSGSGDGSGSDGGSGGGAANPLLSLLLAAAAILRRLDLRRHASAYRTRLR